MQMIMASKANRLSSRSRRFKKPKVPKTHAYDNPELDSLDFLRAVRDDKTVPLALREKAARHLLPYEQNTPDQYPDVPDPLSAHPDMSKYYKGHLEIVRAYYKKFPHPRRSIEYFLDIHWAMSTFHSQNPKARHQPIEFYVNILHVKRCLELTLETGKFVNPDLTTTIPEGHA
jgi:hypothetical protein